MKPGLRRVYGFLVLILIFTVIMTTNCQEDVLPQGPVLIEPEDEAEFTSTPPVFVWETEPAAESYLLKIAQDSINSPVVILEQNTTDTTYELSQKDFDQMPSELYAWAVACLWEDEEPCWSESRTFRIEKQIEETVAQRLYNTYFPMDVGYEWVFQREFTLWGEREEPYDYQKYEVNVTIDSMTVLDDSWVVFHLSSDFFIDVNQDVITNGHLIIINDGSDTISTDTYQEDMKWNNKIKRKKGFGTVHQHQIGYEEYEDNLIYFRKGDTIWRYQ